MPDSKKPDLETDADPVTEETGSAEIKAPESAHETDDSTDDEQRGGETENDPTADSDPDADADAAPDPDAQADSSPVDTIDAPVTGAPMAETAAGDVPVSQKRGRFAPALIGGVLAAALGFLAARSDVLDSYLPPSLRSPDYGEAIATLEKDAAQRAETLAAMQKDIAAIDRPNLAKFEGQIKALSDQLAPATARLETVSKQVGDLGARLAQLESRLSDLEKRPIAEGVSDAAIAAYERELATLQESIAAQRAEVESLLDEARAAEAEARVLEENAAAAAKVAATQATLARLRAALDSGTPYDAIVSALEADGLDAPKALTAPAPDGIASLALLQERFPAAARAALAEARAASDGQKTNLTTFLQRQLGARSTEPREGDDPDAILSRAEAALTAGQLEQSLGEISSLSDAARAAMGDWPALARTRLDAIKAAEALAQTLNTN